MKQLMIVERGRKKAIIYHRKYFRKFLFNLKSSELNCQEKYWQMINSFRSEIDGMSNSQ